MNPKNPENSSSHFAARGFAELYKKANFVACNPWRCLRLVRIPECSSSRKLSRPTFETPSQVYQQVSFPATTSATATAAVAVALQLLPIPNGGGTPEPYFLIFLHVRVFSLFSIRKIVFFHCSENLNCPNLQHMICLSNPSNI